MWNPKLGVKLSGVFEPESPLSELLKLVDYVEYPAPVIGFHDRIRSKGVDPAKLLPHSVYLSTALDNALPQPTLDLLRQQCVFTSAPYLGEHIGFLNPQSNGPSLGYIFSPPLSSKTALAVANNVATLAKNCPCPIALENPAIYHAETSEITTWSAFISLLSPLLPHSTGWVIDCAHLYVSAYNQPADPISNVLTIYSQTGRHIFEVHVAGIHIDKDGVFHDNHSEVPDENTLNETFNYLHHFNLLPDRVTLEFDPATGGQPFERISVAIQNIRRAVKETRNPPKVPGKNKMAGQAVPSDIRMAKERIGRINILKDSLVRNLHFMPLAELNQIAAFSGFKNFDDLNVAFFEKQLLTPNHCVPYFSQSAFDGVDIVSPFYDFLFSLCSPKEDHAMLLLRRILTAICVRFASRLSYLTEAPHRVFLHLSRKLHGDRKPGVYEIYVNDNKQVIAKQATQDIASATAGTHFFEGSAAWFKPSIKPRSFSF